MGDVKESAPMPVFIPVPTGEGLIVVKTGDPGVAGQQIVDPVLRVA